MNRETDSPSNSPTPAAESTTEVKVVHSRSESSSSSSQEAPRTLSAAAPQDRSSVLVSPDSASMHPPLSRLFNATAQDASSSGNVTPTSNNSPSSPAQEEIPKKVIRHVIRTHAPVRRAERSSSRDHVTTIAGSPEQPASAIEIKTTSASPEIEAESASISEARVEPASATSTASSEIVRVSGSKTVPSTTTTTYETRPASTVSTTVREVSSPVVSEQRASVQRISTPTLVNNTIITSTVPQVERESSQLELVEPPRRVEPQEPSDLKLKVTRNAHAIDVGFSPKEAPVDQYITGTAFGRDKAYEKELVREIKQVLEFCEDRFDYCVYEQQEVEYFYYRDVIRSLKEVWIFRNTDKIMMEQKRIDLENSIRLYTREVEEAGGEFLLPEHHSINWMHKRWNEMESAEYSMEKSLSERLESFHEGRYYSRVVVTLIWLVGVLFCCTGIQRYYFREWRFGSCLLWFSPLVQGLLFITLYWWIGFVTCGLGWLLMCCVAPTPCVTLFNCFDVFIVNYMVHAKNREIRPKGSHGTVESARMSFDRRRSVEFYAGDAREDAVAMRDVHPVVTIQNPQA